MAVIDSFLNEAKTLKNNLGEGFVGCLRSTDAPT